MPEEETCPSCGQSVTTHCPRMELGQLQSTIDKLADEGCKFAVAVIEVQKRTYGTAGGNS